MKFVMSPFKDTALSLEKYVSNILPFFKVSEESRIQILRVQAMKLIDTSFCLRKPNSFFKMGENECWF